MEKSTSIRSYPAAFIVGPQPPICFFTGSIYSSPSQNKTLPPRPCSSLKYSLAWKEVYIKATVKGVKTNNKNVYLFLNGKYAGVMFHKNYQYHDSLFKIEYDAFDKCIIYISAIYLWFGISGIKGPHNYQYHRPTA